MESWMLFLLTLTFIFFISLIFNTKSNNENAKPKKLALPPGPKGLPIIGNIHQLGMQFALLEPVLCNLMDRYGPLLTIRFGSRPAIFVGDHSLAHTALIERGAAFAGRPTASGPARIINSDSYTISSSTYGAKWRALRRNLIAEILSPARTKSFADGRRWVLGLLVQRLKKEAEENHGAVVPVESFRYATFCLLLYMCFGERLEEDVVAKVENAQRQLLLNFGKFNFLLIFPRLGKIFFRGMWEKVYELRRKQEEALLPLIRARKEATTGGGRLESENSSVFCYLDSLLNLEMPGGKKLEEGEIISLCSEFLNGGTDTTSTTLQWLFANLVMNPEIQAKLYDEIIAIAGEKEEIEEEEASKMPYLKAVIMETLRRHPPGHFVLPHRVAEEEEVANLGGYVIPKNATINFMVGKMGMDEKIWKAPSEFRPERFLEGGEGFDMDITGTREIKMMPFGVGRRICPGMALAMLHLQYFVANLVREFEWNTVADEGVDLAEKFEFTVVMKNSLKAHIVTRAKAGDYAVLTA